MVLSLVLGWGAGTALLWALGLSLRDALLLVLVVAVQGVGGALVWARVRRGAVPLLELVGMGLAIGTAMALLSGVLLNLLVPWAWWWAVPTVVALVVTLVRRSTFASVKVDSRDLWPWIVGVGAGLAGLWLNLRRYPMNWEGTWDQYHRDMVFFEALGTGVARFGASDSIFMTGAPIRYHWFSYAWAGQVGDAVNAAPFAALTRVLPLVALVGVSSLAISWSKHLSSSRVVPYVAVVLVTAGGYVGAVNGTILNFDSPSQAMSTLWLMGFVVAVLASLRGRWAGALAVTALLVVAMAGGKVSTAVTALGGLGVLMLVGFARRERWAKRATANLLVSLVTFAGTFVLVLAGNASSGDLKILSLESRASFVQGLNSSLGPRGVLIGTLVLIAAVMARWAGALWLLASREWRWKPDVVLALGMGLVGIFAILIFSQGVNETWFALAASAPMAVISAVGLAEAWAAVRRRSLLLLAVVVGIAVTPLIAIAWAHGWPCNYIIRFWAPVTAYLAACGAGAVAVTVARTHRRRAGIAVAMTVLVVTAGFGRVLPLLGSAWIVTVGQSSPSDPVEPAIGDTIVQPSPASAPLPAPELTASDAVSKPAALADAPDSPATPRDRTAWSDAERSAAAWLVANAPTSGVIVTNETLSFMVPALTGMRTYMSGAPYQHLYGSSGTVSSIPDRIATSMAFTATPSQELVRALCASGVDYVWIATDLAHAADWAAFGVVVFRNDAVMIVELSGEVCAA